MLASTAANDDAEADAEADTDADAAEKKQKSNALVVAEKPKRKRHLKGMNDAGELVMSDGSLIGHRQYVSAYRQNHRTTESRESVQIAKLMAEYKALQLPGFGHDRTKFSENTYRVQKMINKQRMRFGNNKAMRLTNKVAAHHFKQQVPM